MLCGCCDARLGLVRHNRYYILASDGACIPAMCLWAGRLAAMEANILRLERRCYRQDEALKASRVQGSVSPDAPTKPQVTDADEDQGGHRSRSSNASDWQSDLSSGVKEPPSDLGSPVVRSPGKSRMSEFKSILSRSSLMGSGNNRRSVPAPLAQVPTSASSDAARGHDPCTVGVRGGSISMGEMPASIPFSLAMGAPSTKGLVVSGGRQEHASCAEPDVAGRRRRSAKVGLSSSAGASRGPPYSVMLPAEDAASTSMNQSRVARGANAADDSVHPCAPVLALHDSLAHSLTRSLAHWRARARSVQIWRKHDMHELAEAFGLQFDDQGSPGRSPPMPSTAAAAATTTANRGRSKYSPSQGTPEAPPRRRSSTVHASFC